MAKKEPEKVEIESKIVELPQIITVRDFAAKLGIDPIKIIHELIKNGIMTSINESIDFDTASIIADEFGFQVELQKVSREKRQFSQNIENMQMRPPVICILGHVDHGKTTLLDAIRKTDVVSTESGGITQHIGAYQVTWNAKDGKDYKLTFLDTPGHAAFSAMRAHGANITDLAILVVAADDGIKPQTKEAISHAQAAKVPIIVAINKIDKPEANIDSVKRQLADYDLIPEEWGGKTVMVPISAKQNKNIDQLLEMIILSSEIENLQADYKAKAKGVVIESHMQQGVGPVATMLIQEGTLRVGEAIVVGSTYGKVRVMEDYRGKRIKEATPSQPVMVAGLVEVPNFGDYFEVVMNEKIARSIISKITKPKHFGLAEASEEIKEGKLTNLNLVIKADTQGSLTAIKNSLESISGQGVKLKIVYDGVGDISESDVNMAIASKALMLGFKVNISGSVKKLADEKGIKVNLYDIIYNLIDDIEAVLKGLIKPEIIEVPIGKFELIKVFFSNRERKVAGGKVIKEKITNNAKVHIIRNGEIIGEGKVTSLQLEKNPAKAVDAGMECGLGIDTKVNIKPGDIFEAYNLEEHYKKVEN